jgi:metal-dependent amidase/aminoacylase/carboxypeptidase family protein
MEKIIARETAEGITISLTVNDGDSSSLQSATVIETMKTAAVDLLGANNVTAITRKTWAADFALLAGAAPASFFYLGAQIAGARRIHHQPSFDVDESGLHLGAAILALSALRLMDA